MQSRTTDYAIRDMRRRALPAGEASPAGDQSLLAQQRYIPSRREMDGAHCSIICRARRPPAGVMRLWNTSFTIGPTMKKLAIIAIGIVMLSDAMYTLAKSSGLENSADTMALVIGDVMQVFSAVLATPRAGPRKRFPTKPDIRDLTTGAPMKICTSSAVQSINGYSQRECTRKLVPDSPTPFAVSTNSDMQPTMSSW